jgi:uncharacterized integral membrane protein (TIGR00697 family)
MATTVVALPPSPGWPHQGAYDVAYGQAPRIVFASMAAYFFGEFVNSTVLAKMKIWTKGKYLWARTIGSTMVGELMDSVLFYPLAFLGIWSTELVLQVLMSNYLLKVFIEIAFTPVTYRVVAYLKRVENEDYYDSNTHFTPFSLELK